MGEVVEVRESSPEDVKDLVRKMREEDAKHDPFVGEPESVLPHTLEWMNRVLARGNAFLFAAVENKPVGYVFGWVERKSPKYWKVTKTGYVCDLYVDEEHRGKGVGRVLLAAAEDWFRKRGVSVVFLDVAAGNPAETFYERAGFRKHEVKMVKEIR